MITITNRSQTEVVTVIMQLIKQLGVRVTRFTAEEELLTHPDYPSLLAVSDCLIRWKIPHESFRIDKEKLNVYNFDFPFLAHIQEKGGRFVLVKKRTKNGIICSTGQHSETHIGFSEFAKIWDGIVLCAEKGIKSGEKDYSTNKVRGILQSLRIPLVCTLGLSSLLLSVQPVSLSLLSFLLFIKIAGVLVSCLLLTYSLDTKNQFVQNLCSFGKKDGCNGILKSEASNITPWLTWSEIGMFYFFGTALSLVLFPSTFAIITLLSVFCLPYTFYSIGYQIKTGNWCVLCCTVQVFLIAEFITAVLSKFWLSAFNIPSENLFGLGFSFFVPVSLWIFLKPLFERNIQNLPIRQQLNKFKHNPFIFSQLLLSQTHYEVPGNLMPIVFGDITSKNVITMVSNPFCGPCAKAHTELITLLREQENFLLKLVFTTSNQDDDERTKVARHISAISQYDEDQTVEKALSDWYAQPVKNYDKWAKDYPVELNANLAAVTEAQREWCDYASIEVTPTILINGYKLPDPYRLEDLKYLLM
jgi:hypothetical protein